VRLFDRVCRVVAFHGGGADNGLVIDGLRVQFEITKTISKEPNTGTVTLTNCNAETRAWLQRDGMTAWLEAGYDGTYRRILAGAVRWCESRHDGTDWTTRLEVVDGARADRARVGRTYRTGTPVATILRDVAQAMGYALPAGVAELGGALPAGVTVSGLARDELTRLLAQLGYSWSIQGEQLQVLRDGAVNADEAWVISEATGLIGVPEYSAPTKSKQQRTLTFSALLFPELTPGGRVQLEARVVRGLHRMRSVKHVGDTHGSEWTSQVEATPLGGSASATAGAAAPTPAATAAEEAALKPGGGGAPLG
jgi:hypothetical protein